MSLIRKYFSLGAAALALFGAGAALADTIIVKSTGPSAKTYPVGKPIAAAVLLVLKPGDAVTILGASGTRLFKGPGTFNPSASGGTATGNSALDALMRNTGTRQVRTGSVRGTNDGKAPRSPNLWYIDARKGGSFCMTNPGAVSIWRPAMEKAATLTLTRLSDGKSLPLAFNVGQSVRAWPSTDMPAADGASYRISGDGYAGSTVKMTSIDAAAQGADGIANALMKNGCTAQLELLVETATVGEASPPPTG